MKLNLLKLALAGAALIGASSALAQTVVTTYTWSNLTRANPALAGFPDPPGTDLHTNPTDNAGWDPWPRAILTNEAPEDDNVWLNKVSGFGYPAGSGIYHSVNSGTYAVGVDFVEGLESIAFKKNSGGTPTLSFNGGTEAFSYTSTANGYLIWDLTTFDEVVESFTLNWTQGAHSQIITVELQLSTVPEPSTWAAIVGGLALTGVICQRVWQRRRPSA